MPTRFVKSVGQLRAVTIVRSDVIGGDGESLVQHGGSMTREECTDEAVVFLANDTLSIEVLPHCPTGPYLATTAVMGQQLLGVVAPSDAVGTAKAWAGGTRTHVGQEPLCFSAGNAMRTLIGGFGTILVDNGWVGGRGERLV
jgi:hypothetical protein